MRRKIEQEGREVGREGGDRMGVIPQSHRERCYHESQIHQMKSLVYQENISTLVIPCSHTVGGLYGTAVDTAFNIWCNCKG